MGLDMYLNGNKFFWTDWQNPENNPTEDGFKLKERVLELGYWRKHPNLHGFIVKTFAEGKDECQDIELNSEDLDIIMEAIRNRSLPETTGFFFGKSYGTDEEAAEDLEILEAAKVWVSHKEKNVYRSVIYRASW